VGGLLIDTRCEYRRAEWGLNLRKGTRLKTNIWGVEKECLRRHPLQGQEAPVEVDVEIWPKSLDVDSGEEGLVSQ